MNPAAVGVQHANPETVQLDHFIAFGQMAEGVHDQPANGIELFVGELGFEVFVELLDGGQALDQIITAGQRFDLTVLVNIMLVFNVADDLLSTSSMVTRPDTPPYSSMTMAM